MRKLVYVLAAATFLAPSLADAQSSKSKRSSSRTTVRIVHSRDDCCWGNRFSFEPYAGAIKDAYDTSADDENTALLLGFRVGYLLSNRIRLLGNVGYSESDNVIEPQGPTTSYYMYDNTWVFTTVGGEFDVVPGKGRISLGLQGGAAFRQLDLDGTVGTPITPAQDGDGWEAQEILIPSLMGRYRVTQWATVMAGLQDHIFDFLNGSTHHSVAITAGIALR
ncbi:MAG TPA: hypothetical protein VGD49_08710 [Longimicrobiales bacterium]